LSRKRVARLMRQAGVAGLRIRRRHQSTRRDPTATAAPDLVGRDFTADRPNALWMGDFTELETGEGVLYLSALLDGCSRACVGWSMRADRHGSRRCGAAPWRWSTQTAPAAVRSRAPRRLGRGGWRALLARRTTGSAPTAERG